MVIDIKTRDATAARGLPSIRRMAIHPDWRLPLTRRVKNILFVMCDQLRADHLSCFGHPTLKTPNLDALAARGVGKPD